MDERIRFVLEAERGFHSFSELCRRDGISRPSDYLWVRRYEDRSHRPGSCPHATPPEIVDRILELRRHRSWGAPKLWRVIEHEFGDAPCVDMVHQILRRNGVITSRKPRRRTTHPGPPTTVLGLTFRLLGRPQ